MEINKCLLLHAASILAAAAILPAALSSIAADAISAGQDALRPLKNSPQSIANGEALVYDSPAVPSGAFHGLFEIRFTIDRNLHLSNPAIQIFVQKEGDSWRKIAEVTPHAKPASGDWTVSYIWNSRAPSLEWTDTAPFKANLKLKFKLLEH